MSHIIHMTNIPLLNPITLFSITTNLPGTSPWDIPYTAHWRTSPERNAASRNPGTSLAPWPQFWRRDAAERRPSASEVCRRPRTWGPSRSSVLCRRRRKNAASIRGTVGNRRFACCPDWRCDVSARSDLPGIPATSHDPFVSGKYSKATLNRLTVVTYFTNVTCHTVIVTYFKKRFYLHHTPKVNKVIVRNSLMISKHTLQF